MYKLVKARLSELDERLNEAVAAGFTEIFNEYPRTPATPEDAADPSIFFLCRKPSTRALDDAKKMGDLIAGYFEKFMPSGVPQGFGFGVDALKDPPGVSDSSGALIRCKVGDHVLIDAALHDAMEGDVVDVDEKAGFRIEGKHRWFAWDELSGVVSPGETA